MQSYLLPLVLCLLYIKAKAWTYDIYGICNYSDKEVAWYEYDGTFLASAPAATDPYKIGGHGRSKDVCGDANGYHHIFQCDHKSCFASNNMRVYWTDKSPPGEGLLAAFWINDNDDNKIQACGFGVTGDLKTKWGIPWDGDDDHCWDEGQQHSFDASQDNYIIIVGIDGKVTFKAARDTTEQTCEPLQKKECVDVKQIHGTWVAVKSSPQPFHVELTYGVTHAYTNTDSSEWGTKVGASMSGGFTAGAVDGSVSVSAEYSSKVSRSYADTLSSTDTEKTTFDWPDGGVAWIWQFDVTDECGSSKVSRADMQLTGSQVEPPCCLPDFFKDIKDPTGECVALPGKEPVRLCSATPAPKPTPTPAPTPVPTPAQCDPAQGCAGGCSACCQSYLKDADSCGQCIASECRAPAPRPVCDPVVGCSGSCSTCCKSYLKKETDCGQCVASQCGVTPTPTPTPPTPTPPTPTPTPPTPTPPTPTPTPTPTPPSDWDCHKYKGVGSNKSTLHQASAGSKHSLDDCKSACASSFALEWNKGNKKCECYNGSMNGDTFINNLSSAGARTTCLGGKGVQMATMVHELVNAQEDTWQDPIVQTRSLRAPVSAVMAFV